MPTAVGNRLKNAHHQEQAHIQFAQNFFIHDETFAVNGFSALTKRRIKS
jgi:hypothetical protein